MPNTSYLKLEGIEGSCAQKGREGTIQILSMEHVVEIPVDVKDATATGTRRHGGMNLVANIDKATPGLMECVCTNKAIPTAELWFFNIDDSGKEVNYYNIKMENVRIVSAKTWYPNVDDSKTSNYKDMMTYSFRYDKITWEFTDGNLAYTDSWNEPAA